ncbi:AAA family ATPase [Clostridium estertheticum]|uniref:AAA family ATPase n=1 Tax=Clostridium estertheticum TaxID=238834 RepID=A0AA47EMG7_9CLOT|nr:AAA family ATPase [Clostridium estertheticum]MBU3157827.1 AAA family ATPase [Clostridium estertheticum]WAG62576.1 AAA family ATPase [Clostridium estertheticum]
MSITKVYLKNFTVFEEEEIAFSNGINVIIGENGTGKTHLLKSIYATCEMSKKPDTDIDIISNYFKAGLSKGEFFTKILKPLILKVYANESKLIEDKRYLMGKVSLNINNSKTIVSDTDEECSYEIGFPDKEQKSIFIPPKEMLSHSKGFLALNNKYDMPFDKTYIDIITNCELPETRKNSELNKKLLAIISKVIDGKVIYENDTFYVIKTNGLKIEFSLEAEGFRKFGVLWRLIRNGLIEKETILLWDEPESNINPELIPVLVDILIELQRDGVQIFVATHSYNFAKYFEIKRKDSDRVLYHNLYKTDKGVKSQSADYFGKLEDNPIIEADSKLLDEVIKGNFEE